MAQLSLFSTTFDMARYLSFSLFHIVQVGIEMYESTIRITIQIGPRCSPFKNALVKLTMITGNMISVKVRLSVPAIYSAAGHHW